MNSSEHLPPRLSRPKAVMLDDIEIGMAASAAQVLDLLREKGLSSTQRASAWIRAEITDVAYVLRTPRVEVAR